jgi:replication factor C small subunit
VREDIKKMAKVLNKKIIFLTEFDQMTTDAQHALRRIMETHKKNTIFIMDANNASKIIPAIKSRCAIFYFQPLDNRTILKYLIRIIKTEKVKVNPKDPNFRRAMTKLAVMSRGDLRSALNNLQTLISGNKEITYKNIVSLQPTEEAGTILNKALSGDMEGAIGLLEEYIIQKNYRWEELFKTWHRILIKMPDKEEDEQLKANKKALAYNIMFKMSDFEDRCRRGNEPLLQISAFLAYVWRAPMLLVKQSATS